jgi:Protein of unknown function (DUF1553)/Protein of unknown function (DUF1549)/Concanavalin A-like lectin/glucanases superfamily/Planctomycete cytochrome C
MSLYRLEHQKKLFSLLRAFCSVLVLTLTAPLSAADSSPKVDFTAEIKPLLSDRCFQCHGPDQNQREAELRFDLKEDVFSHKTDEDVPLIKPGDSAGSALIQRLTSKDPDTVMPPPDMELDLTEKEIKKIALWIDQGAHWEEHWSFKPIKDIKIPSVKKKSWPENEIDYFILNRIEKSGLAPSSRATKEQLIRRLSFDLTGLPPSIKEIDQYLNDKSPAAYEKVVDRLLNSKHYGERMAVPWLDLARYADTHGYSQDNYRISWPWRDWVIEAFNKNLPYDQFVTWQIAGDMLPNATNEQILATGFNRLHRQNQEGGSVNEEFRVAYVSDRTLTFGTTFLGMTLNCCRCHDHKYDPISQEEFYQLTSFFDNIDESGLTSHFTDAIPVPTLLLSDESKDQKMKSLKKDISLEENKVQAYVKSQAAKSHFQNWLQLKKGKPELKQLAAAFSFETIDEKNDVSNSVDPKLPGKASDKPELVDGFKGKGLLLSGENNVNFPKVGVFTRHDPFSLSFWIKVPEKTDRAVILHRSRAANDAASRGYEILIEDGKLSFSLIHFWPWNAMKVQTKKQVAIGEWVHVVASYDGSSRAEGASLYLNGKPALTETIKNGLFKNIKYERVKVDLKIGQRFRDRGFKNGQFDEFKIYNRELTPLEVAHLSEKNDLVEILNSQVSQLSQFSAIQKEQLFQYYLSNHDPENRKNLEQLKNARMELAKVLDPIPELMVMQEMKKPRTTYFLTRGEYDARGKVVTPGTPEQILSLPKEYPKNRLGLAKWLTNPKNPLTARVKINRLWGQFFGQAIAATTEDLGSQGARPTHPELIDWLAKDFISSGWDIKRVVKKFVMSSTYRQSSNITKELLEKDPENELLARAPSYRYSAEMIRDNALSASGLLVKTFGGAPVKPYQPAGLWKEKRSSIQYQQDKDEGLYRRSLYTIWKRTSPPPAMMTFDSAGREVCSARRERTSTPLQALVLMNDPQFVEASRVLAQKLIQKTDQIDKRIEILYRKLTGRFPRPKETRIMKELYLEQKEIFAKSPEETKQFLSVGEFKRDENIPPEELAATTVMVSALFNFDETVTKR